MFAEVSFFVYLLKFIFFITESGIAAMKSNYCYVLLVIFTISAVDTTPAVVMQSGSGDLCTGDLQQSTNCKESEFVQRFYFSTSIQECVEYSTCSFDIVPPNVFDSKESCQHACEENTMEATSCPDLPAIENGISTKGCHNGQCFTLFACHRPYKLVGPSSLDCWPNGQWSGNVPSCVAISVYFNGDLVSDDETVYPPKGTTDLQFECRFDQDIPDNFSVTQEWILLDKEQDSEQFYSDNKSAYILNIVVTKSTEITCSVEVSSAEDGPTFVLTKKFKIEVTTGEEAPAPVHLPFKMVSDQQITIRCTFTGNPKPNVMWYLNGELIENDPHTLIADYSGTNQGTTLSVILIIAPTEAHYGLYSCNATNTIGKSSLEVPVSAPERISRSASNKGQGRDLCSLGLQEQTAMFQGRLTRKLSVGGNQNIYHLKVNAVIHSNNFPGAQTGSLLRVVPDPKILPLDTRRHQSTIFTVRHENGRNIVDSYQPYSNEAEKEIKQRCFS